MKARASRGRGRPADLPSSVRWPLPPPGRARYAWMLDLGVRRWFLRRLLRRAQPFLPPAPRVLDLGAGTGADLAELRRTEPRLGADRAVLVDAQRAMLTGRNPPDASAKLLDGRVLGDVAQLPFRDGTFQVVLSVGLLCCVSEGSVPSAVRETARVLAPGGILVLSVPRWRGTADERATRASGLTRLAGGRPGSAVFRKRLYPTDP